MVCVRVTGAVPLYSGYCCALEGWKMFKTFIYGYGSRKNTKTKIINKVGVRLGGEGGLLCRLKKGTAAGNVAAVS
jgi:hypothetical protein